MGAAGGTATGVEGGNAFDVGDGILTGGDSSFSTGDGNGDGGGASCFGAGGGVGSRFGGGEGPLDVGMVYPTSVGEGSTVFAASASRVTDGALLAALKHDACVLEAKARLRMPVANVESRIFLSCEVVYQNCLAGDEGGVSCRPDGK